MRRIGLARRVVRPAPGAGGTRTAASDPDEMAGDGVATGDETAVGDGAQCREALGETASGDGTGN